MRVRLAGAALLLTALAPFTPAQGQATGPAPRSLAVIAHIDAGINPYHEVFRDDRPIAYRHPSTYIPGYPPDAEALRLSLDEPSWEAAFTKDRAIWQGLLDRWNDTTEDPATGKSPRDELTGKVFWIPGTKIIAATRFSPGGVWCPPEDVATPAPWLVQGDCADYPLLDEHGHGTMTATRMGGNRGSLCPECRIVSIEGLGDLSVKWAADRGWIDVQTNSWGFIVPHPVIWAIDYPFDLGIQRNLEEAAAKMPVYFASGNGANFFLGWTTWPSQLGTTLVKGALWVGAHDNGKVAHWSGAPAHVVADGYGGLAAGNRSLTDFGPSAFTCCTSASSPYAAGQGAAIILEARKILGDPLVGHRNGVLAKGTPPLGLTTGPLRDGDLTLGEFRALVKHTAEARPGVGRDDGWIHWAGDPRAPDVLPWGPGGNAFCQGCWTLPIDWADVPSDFPAYASIGYGAANERSLALAIEVLRGGREQPDRSGVDEFFETEGEVREVVHHPESLLP